MKRFIPVSLAVILAVVLAAVPALAAAPHKVAVVDIQRCVQMTEQGKATYSQLKSELDRIQGDLVSREKEIEEMRTKLEKGGSGVLSESARANLENELRRKSRAYRDLYEDGQARMRQLEMDRTKPILNRVINIVRDMGKAENFDIIINSQAGLVYWNESTDITNKVIELYNSKNPVSAMEKPEKKK